MHLGVRVLKKAQTKIHTAREQGLRHLVLVNGAHFHTDLGVLQRMLVQQGGQKLMRDGGDGRQSHIAQFGGGQVPGSSLEGVELAVNAPGLHGQHLGLWCGREARRGAVEQAVAQLQFGVGHRLADG